MESFAYIVCMHWHICNVTCTRGSLADALIVLVAFNAKLALMFPDGFAPHINVLKTKALFCHGRVIRLISVWQRHAEHHIMFGSCTQV